jgi:hypothetical protein
MRAPEIPRPALDAVHTLEDAVTGALAVAGTTGAEVVDEARVRGGAAWEALRGERVGPPVAVRRWPVALLAALVGAGAGIAVAVLLRRLRTTDAPDALEPQELRAVVDRPGDPTPA